MSSNAILNIPYRPPTHGPYAFEPASCVDIKGDIFHKPINGDKRRKASVRINPAIYFGKPVIEMKKLFIIKI